MSKQLAEEVTASGEGVIQGRGRGGGERKGYMSFVHSLQLPRADMADLGEARESVTLNETPTVEFDEDDHRCTVTMTGSGGI